MDGFDWTQPAVEAAQLIAEANLTLASVAEKVGISLSTLFRWKKNPEFAGRIEENLALFREEVRRRGVAILEKRVNAVNDRWTRLQQVIEARADHPDYVEAPGGTTGLLVRTVKQIGGGESAREVIEFAVDGVLLRELREHEKQAAMELGQWDEKNNSVAVKAGGPDVTAALAMIHEDEDTDRTPLAPIDDRSGDPGIHPVPHQG